jgi:hypothetical protein
MGITSGSCGAGTDTECQKKTPPKRGEVMEKSALWRARRAAYSAGRMWSMPRDVTACTRRLRAPFCVVGKSVGNVPRKQKFRSEFSN